MRPAASLPLKGDGEKTMEAKIQIGELTFTGTGAVSRGGKHVLKAEVVLAGGVKVFCTAYVPESDAGEPAPKAAKAPAVRKQAPKPAEAAPSAPAATPAPQAAPAAAMSDGAAALQAMLANPAFLETLAGSMKKLGLK